MFNSRSSSQRPAHQLYCLARKYATVELAEFDLYRCQGAARGKVRLSLELQDKNILALSYEPAAIHFARETLLSGVPTFILLKQFAELKKLHRDGWMPFPANCFQLDILPEPLLPPGLPRAV